MKSNMIQRTVEILFLITGALAILEFIFVRGMFTGVFMVLAVLVIGVVDMIVKLVSKKYLEAVHCIITTIALCMGYLVLGP